MKSPTSNDGAANTTSILSMMGDNVSVMNITSAIQEYRKDTAYHPLSPKISTSLHAHNPQIWGISDRSSVIVR